MLSEHKWEDIEDMDKDFIEILKKSGFTKPAKV